MLAEGPIVRDWGEASIDIPVDRDNCWGGVNGNGLNVQVSTSTDLIALIQSHRPGDTVQMAVKRGDQSLTLTVPLGESPDEPGRARIGIAILTHLYQYDLPKEVNLQTKNIGGNSAGLMFALGIYNAVSPVDVTKGHKIAGTGTIATDGKVGAIGGAKYKVRAAENAGVLYGSIRPRLMA